MNKSVSELEKDPIPGSTPPAGTRRMLLAAFAIVLALLVSFLFARYSAYRTVQAKFYGQPLVPAKEAFDFRLVDQNGKAFQLSQLRGKVVLFAFGFTHCPNVCPTTLSDLAKVYRALPARDRARVQVLFVSVDPRRDKPETMKNYVPYFDDSFIGLTGTEDQIAQAAKPYGAYYEIVHNAGESPDGYSVNHSAFTYLISPDVKWKLLYNFDQLGDATKVVRDIEQVLNGA
ncbi:MAG: SCO family protein [Verrucomicrobia bacterium]|nr:SCO family protein [Verrucomicrobiota bacterium]